MSHEHYQIPNHQLSRLIELAESQLRFLRVIAAEVAPPKLSSIRIQFSKGTTPMPTPGPVTLTTAGQQVTASVLGFDQLGNPWTGTVPPVAYSIDNPGVATSTPNSDGLTDEVQAVSNGVANLTASLTTAEGIALSDTEAVTVAIPVTPPPTPVLSSIKIAFGS